MGPITQGEIGGAAIVAVGYVATWLVIGHSLGGGSIPKADRDRFRRALALGTVVLVAGWLASRIWL